MEGIREFLHEREQAGTLRVLQPVSRKGEGFAYFENRKYIDFSSNDYLCLSSHPRIKKAAQDALGFAGTSSSASRLLGGDSDLHHALEEKIACFKGKESALIFNSGYQANAGIISALYGREDVVFSDRLSHASIIDGIVLSRAKLFRFQHNDAGHLEYLLKSARHRFKNALIVTETVFSMDGGRPPLKDLVDLKESYNCRLMVDEAHATGIFGDNGSGVVEEEGLTENVDLIMGTFSKALGSFGAYVAVSKEIKEYLVNTSRGFIYSTALPPYVISANIASLDIIKEEPFRRKMLLESAEFFRRSLRRRGLEAGGASQIVPLAAGSIRRAVSMALSLQERGYRVLPVRPPTVRPGEERLRFSLTYCHKKEMLERLIDDICEVSNV